MRYFLASLLGLILSLLAFEALFQCLPVMLVARLDNTQQEKPFSRYLPEQTYVHSLGWALSNPKVGKINKQGFANAPDSVQAQGILVLGDSFIESLMNTFPETIQGYLDHYFPGKVQAISGQGNGLADYLTIIKYFSPTLRPANLIILVEPSDLNLINSYPSTRHNGIVLNNEHQFTLVHNPYTESPKKIIFLKSALFRYLYYNLKLPNWFESSKVSSNETPISADDYAQKIATLNYFFQQLQLLSEQFHFKVVFLLDGDRSAIYQNKVEKNWNYPLRANFMTLAGHYQFPTIDMQPVFKSYWQEKHERFDYFPLDNHWNAVAHKLAAEQIKQQLEQTIQH